MTTSVRSIRHDGRHRTITTKRCTVCGEAATYVDLRPRDVIDHRCPQYGVGPVWVLIGPVPS